METLQQLQRDWRAGTAGTAVADARHVHGQRWASADEMDRWLQRKCERRGVPLVDDDRRLVPYISWARWCADCPECGNGLAAWDMNPRVTCFLCGHRYELDWQTPAERAAVEQLLGQRPDFRRRNWNAHRGETIDRLETENVTLVDVVEGM